MRRRTFLIAAAAVAGNAAAQPVPEAFRNLRPMTGGIQPITDDERRARVEKARRLMRENKIGAIVCEPGASAFYFTGARLPASGRFTAWVFPAQGEPVWVAREADLDRVAQVLRTSKDVRSWKDEGAAF